MRISDWSSDVCSSDLENKVDQKGRVSVPAAFRTALAGLSYQGIVAFPSHRADAVEGCGIDILEQLNARVQEIALFSETYDDLSITIFSESQQLPFDSTGRIQLPEALRAHAGIAAKRSEEHTSELQSLMRHTSADFCSKKKKHRQTKKP